MQTSEQIDQLAAAIAKAQGEIQNVHKDKAGYGYKYADLAAVLDIARPVLSKHGLAVIQTASNADNSVSVTTTIAHVSGQWVSDTITMPVQVGKGMSHAQAVGSVITYARRYSLAAMVGIAQEDNDAAVQQPAQPQAKPVYTIQQAQENLPKWSGQNADNLINKIRTRYDVPAEVEQFIRSNLEAAS
ncbi:hypothetical protein D6833_03715 [Candidatus Parcubacteria bacterium]|nr:MAG: hypothetical protein D6833_03715 [Candidatus Parcubacteria bacterium]